MIRFFFRALLSLPVLAAVVASASAQETSATEGAAPAAENATENAAKDYDAGTVVLTVNGTDVTLGQLVAARRTMPERYQALPGDVLMQALSDELSAQILLAEAAREAGLDEREDVRLAVRTQTAAVLAEAWLRDEISRRVDEARVREEYEARWLDAPQPEEIRAAHILVETREEAEDLKVELDGGADFAALAAKHGIDGTAQRGGDLGWFVHSDMVPAFADAAFALEPGKIGGPVESPFGFHLVRVDERRTRAAPTLEEIGPEIVRDLAAAVRAEVVEDLVNRARIVRADPLPPGDAVKDDALLRQ